MNPRSTAILALVAGLLGAFVYFCEMGGAREREAAEEADKRVFPGLDALDVESIHLVTQDARAARFVRGDLGWQMTEPVEARADVAALDAMASVLAQLSIVDAIAEPARLAEYGLGEGARTIAFEANGEARRLRLGQSTPVGGHVYVAIDDSGDVSYVESFRVNAFDRNLADLRDRRVLPFATADATRIELNWPGSTVELEKEEGAWRMRTPALEPADEPTVRSLLEDLGYLRAQSFVDEEDDATRAALDSVALELRLIVGGEPLKATFGAEFAGGRLVRGQDGRLFTIAPERFEDFERSVSAYRFRTLSDLDPSKARRILIGFTREGAGESRPVELTLEGSTWQAEGATLETQSAEDLVQALSPLRASVVVADEMGPAELASLGLAPPRVRIRVEAAAADDGTGVGEPLSEVLIGRLEPTRGIYAQREGDPKIYLLDASEADAIPTSEEAYVARFLDAEVDASGDDLEADVEEVLDALDPETLLDLDHP